MIFQPLLPHLKRCKPKIFTTGSQWRIAQLPKVPISDCLKKVLKTEYFKKNLRYGIRTHTLFYFGVRTCLVQNFTFVATLDKTLCFIKLVANKTLYLKNYTSCGIHIYSEVTLRCELNMCKIWNVRPNRKIFREG